MNRDRKNIVLIGFMGTGKSTIGKLLSEKLGYTFVDTDEEIISSAGKSISEIFSDSEEAFFRALEKKVVKNIAERSEVIISTGGGVVLDPENMKALSETGTVVCLHCDPKEIHKRTSISENRPLLQGEDSFSRLKKILAERKHLYRGDLEIDTTELLPEDIVNRVLAFRNADLSPERLLLNTPAVSYEIVIGPKILFSLDKILEERFKENPILLVTSDRIFPLWGEKLYSTLKENGYSISSVCIPDGESYKSFESAMTIYTAAMENRLDRRSCIIALGGGVIGDLSGFVASTYMRGIQVIQVPTSLLAQVDSSIGGKTAINHPSGKNMIGTFHQPALVLSDIATLVTLPKAEFINGMAEVIKYGVIMDADLFTYLEDHVEDLLRYDTDALFHVIKRCSQLKTILVEEDEKEKGRRAILNYGHTIGHGIEAAGKYTAYRHGEGVSIGMDLAAQLACEKGLLSPVSYERQKNLLTRFGLPTEYKNLDPEEIFRPLFNDKKNEGGKLRMILPTEIGSAGIYDMISFEEIRRLLKLS